ncbi:MAG: CDP-alcohol phosphatidyltransferase family protein [Spirochaetaceae bacterium]
MSDWDRWYLRWDKGFSRGMAAGGGLTVLLAGLDWPAGGFFRAVLPAMLLVWAVTHLLMLYRSVPGHGSADRLTALRLLLAGVGMAVLLPACAGVDGLLISAAYRAAYTVPFTAAALTDFVDGRVARRDGTGRFGAEWDMQNDAAFTLLLSTAAVAAAGFPAWVLGIGLARYVFVLSVPGSHRETTGGHGYAVFGKSVCAYTVAALIVALALGRWTPITSIALIAGLAGVAVSFGWTVVLLFHRTSHPVQENAAPLNGADATRRVRIVE